MSMDHPKTKQRNSVRYVEVSTDDEGQRIDNFLINLLKNVPKSHIYKLLRKGEVRVNKRRIAAFYRLKAEDSIRLPPIFINHAASQVPPSQNTIQQLANRILYEDENLIILNKPSGMSVHAGSTVRIGIIEALRCLYPKLINLELAHRLDSETSGCLILAKRKRILRELHSLLREGKVAKTYWALTKGKWKDADLHVDLPLRKEYRDGGKHVVKVFADGKPALSVFRLLKSFKQASLMEVKIYTGRTHQIRVHATYKGHPIAGDDRYGDPEFNKIAHQLGLKRMFLHARAIDFTLPSQNQRITVVAPLDIELESALKAFAKGK